MKWTNPLSRMIDTQHILTPFAIDRIGQPTGTGHVYMRIVYVFGIRVAYFNVTPF
jgi:hypothetical protein